MFEKDFQRTEISLRLTIVRFRSCKLHRYPSSTVEYRPPIGPEDSRIPVVKCFPCRCPGDFTPKQQDSFFPINLVSVDLKELVPHHGHPFFGLSKISEKAARHYEGDNGQ